MIFKALIWTLLHKLIHLNMIFTLKLIPTQWDIKIGFISSYLTIQMIKRRSSWMSAILNVVLNSSRKGKRSSQGLEKSTKHLWKLQYKIRNNNGAIGRKSQSKSQLQLFIKRALQIRTKRKKFTSCRFLPIYFPKWNTNSACYHLLLIAKC